jgi:hypothetical protein
VAAPYPHRAVHGAGNLPADVVLAIHAFQLHYGAYAPVGVFHTGQTVQVPGLEWATLDVADLED